jgi:hypothetical protein
VLGENEEAAISGSDLGGLLADLLEGARRRNLSVNRPRMSAPGGRSSRGPRPRAWIRERFLFLIPSPKLFTAGASAEEGFAAALLPRQ